MAWRAIPLGVLKQTGSTKVNTILVSLYQLDMDHPGAPSTITRQGDKAIDRAYTEIKHARDGPHYQRAPFALQCGLAQRNGGSMAFVNQLLLLATTIRSSFMWF